MYHNISIKEGLWCAPHLCVLYHITSKLNKHCLVMIDRSVLSAMYKITMYQSVLQIIKTTKAGCLIVSPLYTGKCF